jgi:hypothetical protein
MFTSSARGRRFREGVGVGVGVGLGVVEVVGSAAGADDKPPAMGIATDIASVYQSLLLR